MASNTATRKSMNGLLNTPTDSENINITQNLDMNSFKIVDLGTGTDATDAVKDFNKEIKEANDMGKRKSQKRSNIC